MSLCDQCRSIFTGDRSKYSFGDRNTGKHSIRINGTSGLACNLCAQLLDRFKPVQIDRRSGFTDDIHLNYWFVGDPMFMYGSRYVHFQRPIDDDDGARLNFKLLLANLEPRIWDSGYRGQSESSIFDIS
jgi:hypothetical protein